MVAGYWPRHLITPVKHCTATMQPNSNRKPAHSASALMFYAVCGTLLFLSSTQSTAQKSATNPTTSAPQPTLTLPSLSSPEPPANPKPATTGADKVKKPALKPAPSSPPGAKQKPAASGTTTRYINLND